MRNPFKRKPPTPKRTPTVGEEPSIASTQKPMSEKTVEANEKSGKKTPEELCSIDVNMPVEDIRKQLAKLFTRHNRAASSFDPELRAEAEIMLEAIVTVREKHVEKL